jgi:branched-chain amino acid transport system ATP-binding protein
MTALHVENLSVSHGSIAAVEGLSFDLAPGAALGLLGANGAGKTSAVEAIAGLIRASSGRVTLGEEDLSSLSADKIVRRGIALVPQWRELFPTFSVEETLIAASGARGQRTPVPLEVIYDYFPKLAERRRQLAGLLSGGEQQMLAIGRALITNPRMILLDEPSAGLSVGIARSLVTILDRICKSGIGVLLVEQNLEIAQSIVKDCIVIAAGRVVWRGPIESALRTDELRRAYFA